jgi:PAS domain S-box-containing protein
MALTRSRLGRQIDDLQQRVDSLSDVSAHEAGAKPRMLEEAREQLLASTEELRVAEEELRQQHEELLATRDALDAERAKYRELFDFAPDGYLVTDVNGIIGEANHAAAELLRLPSAHLAGKPLSVFVDQAELRDARTILNSIQRTGRVDDWPLTVRSRDGQRRHLSATLRLTPPRAGAPASIRWMVRDVTARVTREQEVHTLNAELERRVRERTAELQLASAAKDEFLGLVSHELKTPVTVILGNAGVLNRHGQQLDSESRKAALRDIQNETERLNRIIENLLVLARLERSQDIGSEPVLVQHTLEKAADRHRYHHAHRQLQVAVPGELPPVSATAVYVDQIVDNLLSNAEKYSPRESPIDLTAAPCAGPAVEIGVHDRGEGLAPGDAEHVFAAFYRAPGTAEAVQGLGIGLAVCARLVEAQGGRIRAEAREGGGTSFVVTLPAYSGDGAR